MGFGLERKYSPKINPNTGSFTIGFLCPVNFSGTVESTIVEHKSGSVGYEIFCSSSNASSSINFILYSASLSVSLSYSFHPNTANTIDENGASIPTYFSFVVDKDNNEAKIIISPNKLAFSLYGYDNGFISTYPATTQVVASTSTVLPDISVVSSSLYLQSGTHGNGGFSLSQFSYWSKARSIEEINGSYAGNIFKQDELRLMYRYDEIIQSGSSFLIRDCSGNGLDGVLDGEPGISYFSGSKSIYPLLNTPLTMSHTPLPMTIFDQGGSLNGVFADYVSSTQSTAALYDKYNSNIVTNFVPEAYLQLEQDIGTEVLEKFLYVIARQFDDIKVATDQFVYWNKSNYEKYNNSPDALLNEAANYYGWDFVGNFLNHDAMKYFFGKDVVAGGDLDIKLYEIKNQFWRRTLNELMHIYKTKGTRESVEALIRVYGMDEKLIKLKEYGVKPESRISTQRINSHRSLPYYKFRDGVSDKISSVAVADIDAFSVSLHARFSTPSSDITGTIFKLGSSELSYNVLSGSSTGTISFKDGAEVYAQGSATFADGQWWNIFVTAPPTASGGWSSAIHIRKLEDDTIVSASSFTGSSRSKLLGVSSSFELGHVTYNGGAFDANEAKLYAGYKLSQIEMDAQTFDFQSYGTEDIDDLTGSLRLHWRLDDNTTVLANEDFTTYNVFDYSGYGMSGTMSASIMTSSYSPFGRYLFDYNFIAPVEYGWNEDKIRIYNSSTIPYGDHFAESNAIALEFNIIDALNEDISKILATMDNWNNVIGIPANKYRDSYPDLQKYRSYYFNKLEGRINFKKFADVLEFFDRSFVKMVQRLLPARAVFYGEEFVIESHMLERPKVQWAYRRYNPELVPEGIITMVDRSGSDNSLVVSTYTYTAPSGGFPYDLPFDIP
jgi:hypothetical protein